MDNWKDYEGVIFNSEKEADDALYLDSIQIVEGREVHVLEKDGKFVVTEHPENYPDWVETEAC